MSHHKNDTPELRAALIAHGLSVDEPSQLSDAFRAGYRAGTSATFERAKLLCDRIYEDRRALYKGRAPYTGAEPGRADPYVDGQADGASDCADAISVEAEKET